MDPTRILEIWTRLARYPGGKTVFSRFLGHMAPYTGTIRPDVRELGPGHAVVALHDRKAVRNHLNSLHAIALMNVGEVSTGVAVYTGMPAGGRGIIVGLSMDYKKKARGTITAEARCELPKEPGKHDVQVTADLTDEAGDVVAVARATWKVEIP